MTTLEYDKLLGGGKVANPYTIKVKYASNTAQEKVKESGGAVIIHNQKINKNTQVPLEEKKTEDVENNDD